MLIETRPLDDRLADLAAHYHAHPEYCPYVIQQMADTILPAYLSGYPKELARLYELSAITPEIGDTLTVHEAALAIRQLRGGAWKQCLADEAAEILTLPMQAWTDKLREWRKTHGEENA